MGEARCRCGEPSDGWPADDGSEVCQMCWERECDESWWRAQVARKPNRWEWLRAMVLWRFWSGVLWLVPQAWVRRDGWRERLTLWVCSQQYWWGQRTEVEFD